MNQKTIKRLLALAALAGCLGVARLALDGADRPILAASQRTATSRQNGGAESGQAQSTQAQAGVSVRNVVENPGAEVYAKQCAVCHGDQREGILPAFPPLLGIQHQLSDAQITDLIHKGKGRMPGFPKLEDAELASLLHYLGTNEVSAASMAAMTGGGEDAGHASGLAEAGGSLFRQNCAFCHGRDAMGGETGPDLTQSDLVHADVNGDKISAVIREGRIEKKMPAFNFSSQELLSLVAFIHGREADAIAHKGKRRGVEPSDLQTGDLAAGKQYFNGAGGCSKCHSPTGDLAGIATRFKGLQLEERMLYPRGATSHIAVTLPNGEKMEGTLAYRDEFTVALKDSAGAYHSWAARNVKYKIDSPVDAHVEQFPKYTDDDVHNLMAYLQTLR